MSSTFAMYARGTDQVLTNGLYLAARERRPVTFTEADFTVT